MTFLRTYLSENTPEEIPDTDNGEQAPVKINISGPLLFVLSLVLTASLILTGNFGVWSLVGLLFVPALYTYVLLCNKKSFILFPAILSIAVGFATPQNMAFYFVNLTLPIVMTIAFYYSTVKNYSKTSTVLRMIFVMGFWVIAVIAGLIFLETGTISRSVISQIINEVFAQYKKMMLSVGTPTNFKNLTGVSYEKAIDYLIHFVKVLLPSIFIVTVSVVCYLSALVYGGLSRITGSGSILSLREWNLTVSKFSAIVFAVSYVMSIFSDSSGNTVFYIVVNNLVVILTPGLFVLGMKDIYRMLRLKFSHASAVLTTGAISAVATLFLNGLAVQLIAFIGFWAVVYNRNTRNSNPEE